MRPILRIYWHCSASEWGTVEEIDHWHRERGWEGIGYHYVILNIFPTWASWKDVKPNGVNDGKVCEGRPLERAGSHVQGDNRGTIGVCLIGNEAFSSKQVDAGVALSVDLCRRFNLAADRVWGHNEVWINRGLKPAKSCPNLPMAEIRQRVAQGLLS